MLKKALQSINHMLMNPTISTRGAIDLTFKRKEGTTKHKTVERTGNTIGT